MGQIHFDTTDPMAHTSHPHEWRFSMACGGKTSEKNYSLQVQDDDYMNKIQYFVRIGDSFLQYEYIGTTAPITTRLYHLAHWATHMKSPMTQQTGFHLAFSLNFHFPCHCDMTARVCS